MDGGILRCCLPWEDLKKTHGKNGKGFLHIPKKIWVITYNSPLKFWGGVFFFFRAVLGGKDIIMFHGATVVALSLSLFFQGFQVATPWRWDRCLPITMGESIGNHCKIFAKDCNGELVFVFFFFCFFKTRILGKIMFHANNRWSKCGFGAAVEACKHPCLPNEYCIPSLVWKQKSGA